MTSPTRENKVTAKQQEHLRIAVIGTGAVGGYFGAKLAAAGHELVFLARGKHLDALRRDGLRIVSPSGNRHVRNAVFTASGEAIENVELVLFCVKSYDTETAAKAFAPLVGARTTILSLQNGVDNPEKLAELWGDDRILAGVVYIGAQIDAPGVIHHANGGKIVFGRLDGKANEGAKTSSTYYRRRKSRASSVTTFKRSNGPSSFGTRLFAPSVASLAPTSNKSSSLKH